MMANMEQKSRADPSVVLNEECMATVFSFLVGKNGGQQTVEVGMDLIAAAQLYSVLVTVSRGWKRFLDSCLETLVGGLSIAADGIPSRVSKEAAAWVCRRNLSIKSISYGRAAIISIFERAFVEVLNHCNTLNLTKVNLGRSLMHARFPSRFTHRIFLEALANECPKLNDISLCLDGRTNLEYKHETMQLTRLDQAFRFPLFSHVSKLQIALVPPRGFTTASIRNRTILCGFIQTLPSLRQLDLKCSAEKLMIAEAAVFVGSIQVTSPSLEILRVEDFHIKNEKTRFSLDCPRLRSFSCSGLIHPFASGVETLCVRQYVTEADTVPHSCVCEVLNQKLGTTAFRGPFHELLDPNKEVLPVSGVLLNLLEDGLARLQRIEDM